MTIKYREWKTNYFFVFVDLLMMILLGLNLTLIIFDALFSVKFVNGFLAELTPGFYYFYGKIIHDNFFQIDMAFVTIFLAEFFLSWSVAVFRKIYFKWFFYPFIHWYDLLGCIPLDAFRFVRMFRIYSIVYRLQKLGWIDVSDTYFAKVFRKYYDILMEEISDHVVVNILTGIQEEASSEGKIIEKIVAEVLLPKRDLIVNRLAQKVQIMARDYRNQFHEDLEEYVDGLIRKAVEQNDEIARLERVPVFGKAVVSTVQKTVSNIVFNVIDQLLKDLSGEQSKILVQEVIDAGLEIGEHADSESEYQNVIGEALVKSLEIVKDQVKIKQWKLREEAEKVTKRDIIG